MVKIGIRADSEEEARKLAFVDRKKYEYEKPDLNYLVMVDV